MSDDAGRHVGHRAGTPAAAVRRQIARLVLGGDGVAEGAARAPATVGSVVLRAHQRGAVARLRAALDEFGGALLADDVGLGKTFVALAVAAGTGRVCVVAPAALRDMWAAAARAAAVRPTFASVEALSRGRAPPPSELLVVDEAHHFRNPATRRYRELARLASGARVLLLTATPVHNRRADLDALLALFLGARAAALTPEELARCVVRRERADVRERLPVPTARAPERVRVAGDASILDRIAALPPPVPPRDGGDGGALLAHSLLRQWASSEAALSGALRRRLARAAALEHALATGRHPSRAEMRTWAYEGDAVQLAFPELASDDPAAGDDSRTALLGAVRAHAAAVRALLREISGSADVDRARALIALRDRHAGEKLVAFTAFADTVAALFSLLRAHAGIGALTARGGVVAGGALSRRELLERFAPAALGARAARPAERVDVLLTTDLLSEGVNLQDASVVVHLDLPWTPARLAQRVGRAARLGSAHTEVAVYAFAPPADAERVLAVERLLRAKVAVAARAIGVTGCILPPLATPDRLARQPAEPSSAPAVAERVRAVLASWLDCAEPDEVVAPDVESDAAPMVVAVRAPRTGFLAACEAGGRVVLVASLAGTGDAALPAPSAHPARVAEVAAAAGGADTTADEWLRERALAAVAGWCAAHRAAADAGIGEAAWAPARRRVIERIAAIVRRSPHHRRPSVMALASHARRAALAGGGTGTERVLAELARAPLADDAWLRAVGAFGEARAAAPEPPSGVEPARLRALILLQRE